MSSSYPAATTTSTVNNSSSNKPQIYVHFEFGMSFSAKHLPRSHGVTYMTRSLREGRNQYPRQLPAPNTNYLSDIADYYQYGQHQQHQQHQQQQQQQHLQSQQHLLPRHSQSVNHHHGYHHHQSRQHAAGGHQQQTTGVEPRRNDNDYEERHTRDSSRSSRDRGRSAPPPFNDSPWDAQPEAPGASALPTRSVSHRLDAPLPPSPSQFRLGEDGMPWSAASWQAGAYDPSGNVRTSGGQAAPRVVVEEQPLPFANNPTTVLFSPQRRRDLDPARVHDLGALSAAMMTIDNGFESQWWNQGERLSTADRNTVAGAQEQASSPTGSNNNNGVARALTQRQRRQLELEQAPLLERRAHHTAQPSLYESQTLPPGDPTALGWALANARDSPSVSSAASSGSPSAAAATAAEAFDHHPARASTYPPPVSAASPMPPPSAITTPGAPGGRRPTLNLVVSPISEYEGSSTISTLPPAYESFEDRLAAAGGRGSGNGRGSASGSGNGGGLGRSMTVRSEELFMDDKYLNN